jgi:hypothetical protein
MMVALALMVFDGTIPTETLGTALQPGDETTEQLIRRLFEKAVGNALRIELEPSGLACSAGAAYRLARLRIHPRSCPRSFLACKPTSS